MTELGNWEFDLDGVEVRADGDIRLADFNPGALSHRGQDQDNPVGHGRHFGRDYVTAPVWELKLHLVGPAPHEAASRLAALCAAHRPLRPGAVRPITYRAGGRERVVYGRIRDFEPKPRLGFVDRVVDASIFLHLEDQYSYDTTERAVDMRLQPTATGGFIPPFFAPIITVGDGEVQGVINEVGGNAPAPFEALITGPITNPWLAGDGWQVRPQTTLARGQSALLSTRGTTPSLIRSDGVSLAGTLDRFSRLSDLRLAPGPDRLTFGGIDATGSATCAVTWRPTFYGY